MIPKKKAAAAAVRSITDRETANEVFSTLHDSGTECMPQNRGGKVKEQLRYIGRYIRRPAIGINRIEAYDGQFVTFKYSDKTDGKEKTKTVSEEELISRFTMCTRGKSVLKTENWK